MARYVVVGGSLRVDRDGIACVRPRLSLPWHEPGHARPYNGSIRIYRKGAGKPELNVPPSNPDAVPIPDLLAALGA